MRTIEFQNTNSFSPSPITITRGCCAEVVDIRTGEKRINPIDILSHYQDAIRHLTGDKPVENQVLSEFDVYGFCFERDAAVLRYRGDRTDYLLVGHDLVDGTPYWEIIDPRAVRYACRVNPSSLSGPVAAAQRWRWKLSWAQWTRGINHGGIFFVPVDKPRGAILRLGTGIETHDISVISDQYFRENNSRVYVSNPTIVLAGKKPFQYAGDRYFLLRSSEPAPLTNVFDECRAMTEADAA